MLRGQRKLLTAEVKMNIHNRFDVEVVRNGEIVQRAYAENIVLNQLWARLFSPAYYFSHIHFGTGTGSLDAGRTSLFTFLGAKAVGGTTVGHEHEAGWYSFRRPIQLSETEFVGSTITEVGIGYSATATNLVTHALLKDMNGNTISIQKTSTDIINIYATVFVHYNPAGYQGGAAKLCGPETSRSALSDSPYEYAPIALFLFLGGLVVPWDYLCIFTNGDPLKTSSTGTTPPANDASQARASVSRSYSVALKKITMTVNRVPAAAGNTGTGFFGAAISLLSQYTNHTFPAITVEFAKLGLSSSILGEAIGTGDGSTKDFSTVFPLVNPGSKIYLNGTEQVSGVSVDTGLPNKSNIGGYMKVLSYGNKPGADFTDIPFPGVTAKKGANSAAGQCVFENPFYSTYGINSVGYEFCGLSVSDDLETWITLFNPSQLEGTYTVPEAHRYRRYWKATGRDAGEFGGSVTLTPMTCTALDNYKNIHFDTAPTSGAVITADYSTDVVAKDANHVFDLKVEITLGEKVV